MSYCRFSSDNWSSDVYVYANVDGCWTIHVAGRRYTGEIPKVPPLCGDDVNAFVAAHQAQLAALDTTTMVPIGLPHDCASFDEPTPGACADRLEELQALGYHVPQYAIDELRREASE
jgi:hypothetical protein